MEAFKLVKELEDVALAGDLGEPDIGNLFGFRV